ncbi:putative TonB-dependent receptor [Flavihumibacter petaseus NBRC 106054]|uniref:Putative TonB-dependent receptor n=2 Tax=Flavihumibacter TaxID=1004301 RepID=A0A0E9N3T5_9BACT|nr:putative TonB-dependent receptor [Flavihumibacter petaseus NBRC 106054]
MLLLLAASPGIKAGTNGHDYLQYGTVSVNCKDKDLRWVIQQLEKQTTLLFVYSDDAIDLGRKMNVRLKDAPLESALRTIFEPLNITYELSGKNILLRPDNRPENITVTLASHVVEEEIRGRVLDEQQQPVSGATVQVKGTSLMTVTDANGEFRLRVPEAKGTLLISFVGYRAQEMDITATPMIVKLQAADNNLGEVVVVGYGTQRKAAMTGAVDQIKSKSLESRPSVNVTQALQGLSPNLIIQQRSMEPGGAMNINIRGISTLGDNSPLVVIDGLVGGDLNLLNPSDIDNVSVLKDAGSAAIYGSRSANGVILVTTKRGKKNSRPIVSYNGIVGVQEPKVWYKPVESYENAILRNQSNVNENQPPIYSPEQIRQFQQDGSKEWFLDQILQPAMQMNHNLSVAGGNDKTTYLISAGYLQQENNLVGPGLGLRRYNYRINLNTEVGKLKIGGTLAYARNETKDHSANTSTLIVDAGRTPTYYDMKDDQGRYLTNEVLAEYNPLGILEKGGYRKYDDDNLFANITGELGLYKGLKLKGVFGGTLASNHVLERIQQVDFFPSGKYGADRNTNDRYNKNLFLNTQLMLEYMRSFGDHNVTALVGFANESVTNQRSEIRKKYTDPELGTPTTGTVIDDVNSINSLSGTDESSLNSVFGRVSYSLHNRYFAEVNFRVDASSKFAPDNRNAFFPSVSAGWRLTDEDFMADFRDRVGNLKLRGSYGILGNQNVNNYQYQTTYTASTNAYGFNNQPVAGVDLKFANPDIRWERAATFNIGVEGSFLKNRLTASFDYFNKLTSDILITPAVPGVFGGTVSDYNAGKVRNKGWELTLNYQLPGKQWNHSFGFNIADSRNEVVYFQGNERITSSDEMQIILREGLPYNSYIGLKRDGYFQNLDDIKNGATPTGIEVKPGDIRYVDRNKDGVIDDQDRFVLGNPFPRYTFGFNYNVSFRQFDLGLLIQGVGQRDMFVRGELVEPFHFNYSQVMYQHQLDYWTPVNPNAYYPRLAPANTPSNQNNYRRGSDLYIFEGAYARLKNIQVGYSLPARWLEKASMQRARFYVVAQNLFTVSGVSFIDPESTEFTNSLQSSGANSGRNYPTPVFYGAGLDITFK